MGGSSASKRLLFRKKKKPKGLFNRLLGKKKLNERTYYNSMMNIIRKRRVKKALRKLK